MNSHTNETEKIVEDVKKVAKELNKERIGRDEYINCGLGKFSKWKIYEGGRTWTEICNHAGLKTKSKSFHRWRLDQA